MNRYEAVFVFNSEEKNKWKALEKWLYEKPNSLKDNQDFVAIEEIRNGST